MTSTFEAKADEWFAEDIPYDAEAIDSIRRRMGAIWDECAPMVSMPVKSPDTGSTSANLGKFVSGVSPQCFFCRPFLLLPGTTKISFYVYGRVKGPATSGTTYRSNLFAHQGIEAQSQPSTPNPSPTGDNFLVVDDNGGTFQVHELSIDFGLSVERPRFTMLQLWHRSAGPSRHTDAEITGTAAVGFPPMPGQTPRRNTIADHEGVIGAMTTPKSSWVYRFEDSSRGVLAYHDILALIKEAYPSGGAAATPNTDSFILYPDVTIRSTDVDSYSVEPISYFEYRAIAVKVHRDSTADDTLYRGDKDFFQPGRKTETQAPDGLESAAQTLYSRIRPISFGMMGNDVSMPSNGDQYQPLHEYLDHNSVKMLGMVLAAERGSTALGGRRIDALLEMEVMTLNATGDPATVHADFLDSVTAEGVFSFSFDAVLGSDNPDFSAAFFPNSVIALWQTVDFDTNSTINEGHMSEEDVNALRSYAKLVQLDISNYTKGDKYAGVEDREFRILRLSLTNSDGTPLGTKLYVLPFFYLERVG